ncbi:hypothetical protein CEXT_198941 [Caerostris extrusa]|uniref:Uncharacterized protein n=1 Tax=Caerostris extrusa TaxID=172846 RepID=A0AAV4WRW8_CAEEX|nr:hypothetical protein CEXT_198941 [Caerostris extrusa]
MKSAMMDGYPATITSATYNGKGFFIPFRPTPSPIAVLYQSLSFFFFEKRFPLLKRIFGGRTHASHNPLTTSLRSKCSHRD